MRIAFLFGKLNRGGAETLALDVIRNSDDIDLSFICIHRKCGELYEDFRESTIPIFQLAPKSFLDFNYIIRLRKTLRKEKIQIIHTHQVADSLIAKIATLFTKIKTVQTFHGHGYNYSVRMRIFRRIAFSFNARNIFVSNSQFNSYQKRFKINPKKSSVVYNGILLSKFSLPPSNQIRKDYNIDNSTIIIGTVGNFTNGRDHMTICRFLKLLDSSGINFVHLFIGGPSKTEPWFFENCTNFCKLNKLNEKVLFLGSRTDVPELLKQLDVFVYSTEHDTFGIALIEAIAAEIPVFANNWRVFNEITLEGKLATLYNSKDEHDLIQKFLGFISKREVFVTKAKEAAQIVKNNYDIQMHIRNLSTIYNNLFKK